MAHKTENIYPNCNPNSQWKAVVRTGCAMKLNYGEEDKDIRLSGHDEFVFQDRDASEVRQEPIPDPALGRSGFQFQ
jgi:hypothetical protein